MSKKRKKNADNLSKEEKKALSTVLQLPSNRRNDFYKIAGKVLAPSEKNIIVHILEVQWDGMAAKPRNRQCYTLEGLVSKEHLQLLASAALVYVEEQKKDDKKEFPSLYRYVFNYNL